MGAARENNPPFSIHRTVPFHDQFFVEKDFLSLGKAEDASHWRDAVVLRTLGRGVKPSQVERLLLTYKLGKTLGLAKPQCSASVSLPGNCTQYEFHLGEPPRGNHVMPWFG